MSFAKRIYSWASKKANSRYSALWIGVIFFLEIIFFLPMDAVLLLFCLENHSKRYVYVIVATLASVLSGLVGYLLGWAAWEAIGPFVLDHLISKSFFAKLNMHYHQHQHIAIFLGSFLPVPFKAVTLTAGVCNLALLPFTMMIFVGRLIRFSITGFVVEKWGIPIKKFFEEYFHHFLFALFLKIGLALIFFWALI